MPETRYIDIYDKQGNLIGQEPYVVSDKDLQDEADLATALAYLAQSPPVITMPEMWWLIRYMAKHLGISPP